MRQVSAPGSVGRIRFRIAAIVTGVLASLVTAGLGCLLFTGFLVNRYGELTWDGTTSVWRAIVLAAAVGIGAVRGGSWQPRTNREGVARWLT
ncbi:hypothetical protein K1W54_07490 [Micromonospora sp. CPCC 205371]|nr:hypothetical protein [Micromonospora sp. CPCC 205371]